MSHKKAFLICLVLTVIFLQNYIFNLNKPPSIDHFDAFHLTLVLRHYRDVSYSHSLSGYLEMPMFSTFKHTMLFSELFLAEGLLACIGFIFTSNVILIFNLLAIFSLVFSVYTMYLLALHFTNKPLPSLVASIIYVFNPFVMGHFPDNLHYYSLYLLPLIFLCLEIFLTRPSSKIGFLFFFFIALQVLTSLTYFSLLTVILPIYFLIRYLSLRPKLKSFFNSGTIIGALVLALVTLPMFYLYHHEFPQGYPDRGMNNSSLTAFSPWPSDFFFTGPRNLLYGNGRDFLIPKFPNYFSNSFEVVERNLFWGFTVIILFIVGIFKLRRPQIPILCLVILTFVFSFGPRFHFTYTSSIPAPFAVVALINPLVNQLRVASRFYFFTYLFLGLFIAITVSRLKPKLLYLIIPLILIEYWTHTWKFTTFPPETILTYSIFENNSQLKTVLELPIGNLDESLTLGKNHFVDAHYMLYASALHHKTIFNGYSSYNPPLYTQRSEYLSVNFPSAMKLQKIKSSGIDAIIVHRDEFMDPNNFEKLTNDLNKLKVPQLSLTENLALYSLKDWTPSTNP